MTLNYTEYHEIKDRFFSKHHHDFTIDTGAMDRDGKYNKVYSFSDGAQWIDVYRPVWRTIEITTEIERVPITVKQDVKLFETESWNSDDPKSIYYYEKF
jgi:hypothetical protein